MPEVPAAPEVLLNFLYKDVDLAKSFYAQIYTGLLREFHREEASKSTSESEKSLKIGPRFLQRLGGKTVVEEGYLSSKEVLDPHDTLFLDLLSFLNPYIKKGISEASHGDLISATGRLLLISKDFWRLGAETFISFLKDQHKNFGLSKKEAKVTREIFKRFLSIPQFSSRFFLDTPQGRLWGYLNESFLSEPLDALLFKYSNNYIPNVTLVGIKEVPEKPEEEIFPEGAPEAGIMAALGSLSTLISPGDYIVKPLFIYYPTRLS